VSTDAIAQLGRRRDLVIGSWLQGELIELAERVPRAAQLVLGVLASEAVVGADASSLMALNLMAQSVILLLVRQGGRWPVARLAVVVGCSLVSRETMKHAVPAPRDSDSCPRLRHPSLFWPTRQRAGTD